MTQKVRIVNLRYNLLPGRLSRHEFDEHNKKIDLLAGETLLLCSSYVKITKAALETESFLSAASFKKQLGCLLMQQLKEKSIN